MNTIKEKPEYWSDGNIKFQIPRLKYQTKEDAIMSSQFKPWAGYKKKVIESFNRQAMMKTINASILAIRPGEIELEFPSIKLDPATWFHPCRHRFNCA